MAGRLTSGKQLVKAVFNAAGLEIRKRRPAEKAGVPRARLEGALRQLGRLGFEPRTVIDVGVAYATSELYEQFPGAQILLVEPLAEFEPFLQRIAGKYNAQYVLAAAGEAPGTAMLNVHRDKFGSSLLKEVEGSHVDGTARSVPVVTLDDLCAERKLAGPYLIKIDVQGAELRVLAGAKGILREVEAVILEVTLFGTMVGGPQLWDVVSRMKELGFAAYDVFGLSYRPLDNALCQVDMTFVREGGRFRASHAFATAEQRQANFSDAEELYAELTAKKR
jgi:FkbM family methyltransferase